VVGDWSSDVCSSDLAQYYTFGTSGPTAALPIAQAPGASNPRQYSLAAPIGVKVGLRVIF